MITIDILTTSLHADDFTTFWACWLEISQAGQTWMLPATAPGTLAQAELQVYFDSLADELWVVAEAKECAPSICGNVDLRRVVKAKGQVILDELNFIRTDPGHHPPITEEEFREAVKAKLKDL